MTQASKQQISAFLQAEFPQADGIIELVDHHRAVVRHPVGNAHLRPGGTVSGPTLMATADFALYVAILGHVGIVPLVVTTNLNINFLRKPVANRDIIGDCQLLKTGKALIVGEVSLYSEGEPGREEEGRILVAHAVGTYSVPPEKPEKQ